MSETTTSPTTTATLTENAIRKRLRRQGYWLRKSRSSKERWLYRTGEIGSNIVDGEAVLMSVANGKYYRLDDIGTRIWTLIETPTAIGAVCDQLIQELLNTSR